MVYKAYRNHLLRALFGFLIVSAVMLFFNVDTVQSMEIGFTASILILALA